MIKAILLILNIFRPLFTRLGIDYKQMNSIVTAKLTVNNRIEKKQNGKQNANNTMLKQGIIMSLTGPLLFFFALRTSSLPSALLLFHSLLCFTVFINFLSEYSQLLFNKNDNEILQRLPVASKTIQSARIVSMLVHILFITMCLSIIPFVIVTVWQGILTGILFIVGVIFNTIFSLLLANIFYVAIMQYAPVKNFQKVISYVQVILVALLVFSYQFFAKSSSQIAIDFTAALPLWMYFTPPAYYTAITEFFLYPTYYTAILGGMGIGISLLLFILTITYFSSSLNQKVAQIETETAGQVLKPKSKYTSLLAGWFTRNPLQNSGFTLTWVLTDRTLNFRQAILPMFVCIIVPNCMAIYQAYTHSHTKEVLFPMLIPLYMLPLLAAITIPSLGLTDKGNKLWLYQSKPLAQPGQFLMGCFKAIYIKYFVPIFLVFALVYIGLTGIKVIVDLLLIFSFCTLFSLIYFRLAGLLFPFSKEQDTPQSQVFKMFMLMAFLGVIAVVHFTLTLLPYGTWIALPVCWGIIYLIARKMINISWKKVEAQY